MAGFAASLAAARAALTLFRSDRDIDGGPGDDERGHVEANTYGLPAGTPIKHSLIEWYDHIAKEVLESIPDTGVELPASLAPIADYDDPMASAMTPLLSPMWDESGKRTMARLKLDPDEWRVTSPKLHSAIHSQALTFCSSTLKTTSKDLHTVQARLREELKAGLIDEGESLRELRKRVQSVFEGMRDWKAAQIAATEASRAVHSAQLMADEESDVVAGVELLLSSDACPLCRKIATEAKRVRLGHAFAVVGHNPDYKNLRHPPLHPHCQCAMIEVLKPEFGGPENPEWSKTLDQPQRGLGDDYEPPKGQTVPEPEPDRLKLPLPAPPPPAVTPLEPPKPTSTPVSAALDVKATGDVGREIRGAIATIDGVHGDGKLPSIPVFGRTTDAENTGEFAFDTTTGKAAHIGISPAGERQRLTFIHETGHFIDGFGIPRSDGKEGPGRSYSTDPAMKEWWKAVQKSDAVKTLKGLRGKSVIDITMPDGKPARLKLKGGAVDYLLRNDELWARSYAQYVATRSSDTTLRKELGDSLGGFEHPYIPRQWNHQDFEPIAAEFDRLFTKLGWLPPPRPKA